MHACDFRWHYKTFQRHNRIKRHPPYIEFLYTPCCKTPPIERFSPDTWNANIARDIPAYTKGDTMAIHDWHWGMLQSVLNLTQQIQQIMQLHQDADNCKERWWSKNRNFYQVSERTQTFPIAVWNVCLNPQ